MRPATLFALVLFSHTAFGLQCPEVVAPGARRADGSIDEDFHNRYHWKRDYARYAIVVEATIKAIRSEAGHTIVDVTPSRLWKSDGAPVHHIFFGGSEYPTPCAAIVEVGKSYVLFADRAPTAPAAITVLSTPLYVRRAVPVADDILGLLGELALEKVAASIGRPPNKPLQRSGSN
jgi:hypothetical protein